MKRQFLPIWVGLLAIFLSPTLSYGQTTLPWQVKTNAAGLVDEEAYRQAKEAWFNQPSDANQHVISQSEFATMPAEKQAQITANPDKYVIKDIQMVHPGVAPSVEVVAPVSTEKNVISESEFATMPAAKQAHIMANPDKYVVKDVLTSTPTSTPATIIPQNAAKNVISRKEMQNMSAEKVAHINANLDKYEITE